MTTYATDVYSGTGSQVEFAVTFSFIQRDHVKVFRVENSDGSETELFRVDTNPVADEYEWMSDVLIEVATAPTTAQKLRIQRDTPIGMQLVQWKDGSYVIADNLNTSEKQSLYLDQQLADRLTNIENLAFKYFGFIDVTTDKAPANPTNGTFYVNTGVGSVRNSWIGIVGDPVVGAEQVVFNSVTAKWEILQTPSSQVGVNAIAGDGPITVDGSTPSVPVIGIVTATPSSKGALSAGDKAKLDSINSGAGVDIQQNPPSNPEEGQVWWDKNDGRPYIWYEDADSQQWVDFVPNNEPNLTDQYYIYPGGEAQSVQKRLEQYVSVYDFIPGSKHAAIRAGTSTYDCTADIQAAFDWWAGDTHRSLIFPKGEFICTSTIQAVRTMTQVLIGNSLVGQGGRLKFQFPTDGDGNLINVFTSRFGLVLNLDLQGRLMRELHIAGLSLTGNFDEYAMILDGGYSTSNAYLYGFVIERLYTSSRGLCVSGNAFEGVVRECYIAGEQGDGDNPLNNYIPTVSSVLVTQADVIGVEATDISFATNKTITTGGSINFAAKYKVDDEIIIRGSAQNDGTYTVKFVDSTTIRTYETTITTETAGNNILFLGGSGGGSRKISSMTLDSNNIRGGKFGILITDGAGDVTLRNNTTLTSWNQGLFYNSTFSGCNILHHHAENCWQQYSESKWLDPGEDGFFDENGKRWSGKSGDGSGSGDGLVEFGSLAVGDTYTIKIVGNTNWAEIGGPASPAVGNTFTATNNGSSQGEQVKAFGSLVVGDTYIIKTVGNTSWTAIGGPASPAVGNTFTATNNGQSEQGTNGVVAEEGTTGIVSDPIKGNWFEWFNLSTTSNTDRNSVLQRSGVRVVESAGAGNILGCRQVNDANGGTMSAITIFSSTTQPTFISGTNASGMGTEVCVSGSGSVFLNTDDYKITGNWPKIIQTTGATTRPMLQSVLHGTGLNSKPQGSTISQYTPFAQSSQSSILGSVFVPLKQGLTVNAPSSDYIPSYGDELHFTFQQNQSTSAVVTFDSVFRTNGFVAKTGTKAISTISFRYIKDVDDNDRWIITGSSPGT